MAANGGFVGLCVNGQLMGVPTSDPLLEPFYQLSIEADRLIMILTGLMASGRTPRLRNAKTYLCCTERIVHWCHHLCPPMTSWIAGPPPLFYKENSLRDFRTHSVGEVQWGQVIREIGLKLG